MAAILVGVFAVPLGIFMAGRTEITLAFISAAVLFLPLFVFLPKLKQAAMKADTDAAIEAFGKNERGEHSVIVEMNISARCSSRGAPGQK